MIQNKKFYLLEIKKLRTSRLTKFYKNFQDNFFKQLYNIIGSVDGI